MPAYPHEVAEARDEGVELRFLAAPARSSATGGSKPSNVAGCGSRPPTRAGVAVPSSCPGPSSSYPPRRSCWPSASSRDGALLLDQGTRPRGQPRRGRRRDRPDGQPEVLRGRRPDRRRDRRRGGARRKARRPERWRPSCDRDSLHGRAGQGAKTASQLLAAAAMDTGQHVQAFPEYGPERSGAPMRAYTRIDTKKIRRRYGITDRTSSSSSTSRCCSRRTPPRASATAASCS